MPGMEVDPRDRGSQENPSTDERGRAFDGHSCEFWGRGQLDNSRNAQEVRPRRFFGLRLAFLLLPSFLRRDLRRVVRCSIASAPGSCLLRVTFSTSSRTRPKAMRKSSPGNARLLTKAMA
jgi:hypothetical protein